MILEAGTRLGPYEVIAFLGSGGMAEVYQARDVRLEREVAIKILPEDIASDPASLARFTREARTASALNHPHLVTIYDIGEAEVDDCPLQYIAMELIRGGTFRDHLAQDSRDVLLRYIADTADGLAKAHEAGVVHRDLKPENIVVSDDGFAKVVDFGLAKRAPGFPTDTSGEHLTEEGLCIGTAGYMAPEQVRGERDIDGRADIFALGCMLYEVIAKATPFEGLSAVDTMYRVLTIDPPPLSDPAIDAIVRRCVAKDRSNRYPSMREVAADLRKAIMPAVPVEMSGPQAIASIAVLPFHNRSGNEEMRFLSDGIPEDIVRDLGRVPGLRVIASSSAARFRDSDDPLHAARELNVESVLVGSLRTISGKVLVDAELVRAADGTALWGKKYTRELKDVIELEQEIARDLCEEVRLKIAPSTGRAPDPEAHAAYLRGQREVVKETAPGLKKGIEYFHRAIEIDPQYALPYAAIGLAYGRMAVLGVAPTRDCLRQQAALAQQALELDDALPEAHHNLAIVAELSGNMADYERHAARVLSLNPNFALTYVERFVMLTTSGRFAEAEAAFQKARELDPLSPRVLTAYAGRLGLMRRFEYALRLLNDATLQFPDYVYAHALRALVESHLHRHAEAVATIDRIPPEATPNIVLYKGMVYARAGRTSEARTWADLADEAAKTRFIATYYRAQLRGELGDVDSAIALVEQGLRQGDWYYSMAAYDPGFDAVRSDPRFDALLQRRHSRAITLPLPRSPAP